MEKKTWVEPVVFEVSAVPLAEQIGGSSGSVPPM
jgi:hypothetical protein